MASPDFDPFNHKIKHDSLNLVLSTPQKSDGDAVLKALNDPKVYNNLIGPPFPYTLKDREIWYAQTKDEAAHRRQEWAEFKQNQARVIERSDDGTPSAVTNDEKWVGCEESTLPFIGEVTVRRCGFEYVQDVEDRRRAAEINTKLPAGDPDIVWEIGCYLIPEYHGKGIMPAVLNALKEDVLIPIMNTHRLIGAYLEHNTASRRVFEKCGFDFLTFVPKAITFPEAKSKALDLTSREIGYGVMEWKRNRVL